MWDLRDHKSIGTIYGPNLSGDSLDFRYINYIYIK